MSQSHFHGACQRCGAADGTLRAAPSPSPVSGVWCDRCERFLARRARLLRWGIPCMAVLVGLLVALLS